MKQKLEEIFDGLIEVEYETKCVLEMMSDYKDLCCVENMADWERRMTVFLKALKGISTDLHKQMLEIDKLLNEK